MTIGYFQQIQCHQALQVGRPRGCIFEAAAGFRGKCVERNTLAQAQAHQQHLVGARVGFEPGQSGVAIALSFDLMQPAAGGADLFAGLARRTVADPAMGAGADAFYR